MTNLSPAAQAVKNAVLATYDKRIPRDESLWRLEQAGTVAALRAAADQVVPVPRLPYDSCCDVSASAIRAELMAIAAELEADGPAVSDDREPASVTDQITHQLHRRATVLLIRKVIDQALRDTASVQWRVADTGEQLVRASDLVAWADHMEEQMRQLND